MKKTFFKTDHFIFRQWDRKITDELVSHALRNVSPTQGHYCIIVSRRIVKQFLKIEKELYIITQNKRLITCYLEKIHLCKSKKIKDISYIIIDK